MDVHVADSTLGFGNVLIKLADFFEKAPAGRVDENIKDFERGRAFNFNVKFTKDEPSTIDGDINLIPETYNHLGSILPTLMSPTRELCDLFNAKLADLEGVGLGIHIRCGGSMPDCKGLSVSHGGARFASEKTFKCVHNILNQYDKRVFLASDSKEVKRMYKDAFGDKVVVFDTLIALSCVSPACGGVVPSPQGLMDAYLEWFTLSNCPIVCTTAGYGYDPSTDNGAGTSTFGYTAAAYGRRTLNIISCDGEVTHLKFELV